MEKLTEGPLVDYCRELKTDLRSGVFNFVSGSHDLLAEIKKHPSFFSCKKSIDDGDIHDSAIEIARRIASDVNCSEHIVIEMMDDDVMDLLSGGDDERMCFVHVDVDAFSNGKILIRIRDGINSFECVFRGGVWRMMRGDLEVMFDADYDSDFFDSVQKTASFILSALSLKKMQRNYSD